MTGPLGKASRFPDYISGSGGCQRSMTQSGNRASETKLARASILHSYPSIGKILVHSGSSPTGQDSLGECGTFGATDHRHEAFEKVA